MFAVIPPQPSQPPRVPPLPQATAPVSPPPAREQNQNASGGEGNIWNTISQVHHEEMVYEISDLLHRRLVSSALASEFRSVMELHIQV